MEHVSWNAGHGKVVKPIPSADPKTFKQLSEWYGKDHHSVYWMSNKIEGADPSTFRVFNNYYAVDRHRGYFTDAAMAGSEGKSFRYIKDNWSRDAHDYYYGRTPLKVDDLDTFEIIDEFVPNRAVDKYSYYYQYKKVPIKDRSSLVIMKSGYAKDAHHVYWAYFIIEEADPQTFEVQRDDTPSLARDKNHCYSGPRIVQCHELNEEGRKYCRCNEKSRETGTKED